MTQRQTTRPSWEKPWIAYVGMIAFPEGGASARRVLGVAKTLVGTGVTVVVAAGGLPSSDLAAVPVRGATKGAGLFYQGIGEFSRSWSRMRKSLQLLWGAGRCVLAWLDRQPTCPSAVICYGTSLPLLARLRRWCRKNSVVLVCDVVEWYAGAQLIGGRCGPLHAMNEYSLRRLVPVVDGVIAISSLLRRYYEERGCLVTRIPPTADMQTDIPCRLHGNDDCPRIRLVYAGVPGSGKDLLGYALHALNIADPEGKLFQLKIIGPTEREIQRLGFSVPSLALEICGRRSHQETLAAFREADYSILLRPNKRFANAGFPTKVVESLACGTPVICNLTSDLGEYINHGVEGCVCPDHSIEGFAQSLRTILKWDRTQLNTMRAAARARAERSFDCSRYIAPMKVFLQKMGMHG